MAEAKTPTARRPIARTYGGVQWFKVERGTDPIPSKSTGKAYATRVAGWRASITGTSLCVFRNFNQYSGLWNMQVQRWDGQFWVKHQGARSAYTVGGASGVVQELRRLFA